MIGADMMTAGPTISAGYRRGGRISQCNLQRHRQTVRDWPFTLEKLF
jgi:hypothetical protein